MGWQKTNKQTEEITKQLCYVYTLIHALCVNKMEALKTTRDKVGVLPQIFSLVKSFSFLVENEETTE